MAYTVLDLKQDLSAIGHGLNLDSVTSPNSLIERAANDILSEIDFFELAREEQIANSIYSSIYDYPISDDIKMDSIIDIFPQVNRLLSDKAAARYTEEFDRKKSLISDLFTIEYRNGIKLLRFSKQYTQPAYQPITIGDFSALTRNGTWTLGGDATNLTLDTVNYVSGTASLRFDLSGAGTTWFVEADDITATNILQRQDGSIFNWIWFPDASQHTSIEVRVGSSSTDFYSYTNTAQYFGSFVDGWNQLQSVILNGTATGSPDLEAITYLYVGGVYDGEPVEGMRLDSATALLGTKHLIRFYSNKLFKDAVTGEMKDTVDDDSDIIMLENASRNGLIYKSAEFMAQQVMKQNATVDLQYFLGLYTNWRNKYAQTYKTQKIKPKVSYWGSSRGRNYRYTDRFRGDRNQV